MRYRVNLAGLDVWCSSPSDVIDLARAAKAQSGPTLLDLAASAVAARLTVKPKKAPADVFEPNVLAALMQGALDSNGLIELLDGNSRKVGPTVSAWKRRATAAGINLSDCLLITRPASRGNGRVTTYELTKYGREVFGAAQDDVQGDPP